MNVSKLKIKMKNQIIKILTLTTFVILATSIGQAQTTSSITLNWTAPGDDGNSGVAYAYDIRYSTSMINDGNWNSAIQISDEPTPSPAGSNDSYVVNNLQPNTTYYFAIKTFDDANNCSGMSNIAIRTTGAETEPPANIANLATTNPSLTSIGLTWTAPGDDGNQGQASEYDIRYSTATINDANWNSATQVSGEPSPQPAGSQESHTVSGLQSGVTYYFAIKTRDDASNLSGLSNIASGTTQVGNIPPSDVDNLSIVNPSSNSVTLVWTAPGADGDQGTVNLYDIRYSTSMINDGNWSQGTQIHNEPTPQPAGSEQSVTISGLTENTTYYFGLKSVDDISQWSNLSNIASAYTQSGPDQIAPSAVADFLVANFTANSATLTWTAPGDDGNIGQADVYDIRYNTVSITNANWGQCTPINNEPDPQVGGSAETVTISGLTEGVTYYFAIKTYDEVPNYSYLSNIATCTTENETVAPQAITSLQISQANQYNVNLRWTAPGDDGNQGQASQYDVRYSLSPITESNFNLAAQATGEPSPSPAGAQENFTITGLAGEIRYYFAVKTADEVPNWSSISNVVNVVTPDQTAPADIDDLNASAGEDVGSVMIGWTAPGDDNNIGTAESYVIKVHSSSINESNWDQATTISNPPAPLAAGLHQNFQINDLVPGNYYYVAMVAEDNAGNVSEISNVGSAEALPFGSNDVDELTGLPKTFELSQNYPNPFNPTTNIEFALPEPSHVNLNIYDANGRFVTNLSDQYYQAGFHTISWHGEAADGREVSTGVYFYHLSANDFESYKKMVFLK
jgi:hypothetical protein